MDGSKMDGVHVIDVNKLVSYMTTEQKSECSGGDIPEWKAEFPLIPMMKHHYSFRDKEVHKPPVITIGPYHHINKTTFDIEKLKWDALSYILRINPKMKMRDYIVGMEELEQQIRSCYANEIKMSRDSFLKMMLLGGCFILYALCGPEGIIPMVDCIVSKMDEDESILELNQNCGSNIHMKLNQQGIADQNTEHVDREDNTCYANMWYTTFFSHDLLLLENQIPFFVVKKIYELVTAGRNSSTSLLNENIANSIEYLIYSYPKIVLKFDTHNHFHHLLHLCHMYFKPAQAIVSSDLDNLKSVSYQLDHSGNNIFKKTGQSAIEESGSSLALQEPPGWHRASEYHRGGIEFRKRETCNDDPHSLLDIGFCDGVLERPSLTIDTNTYHLFQNLIAFEQTSPQVGNYMTTYVVFLSQLVSEPDDVSLLTKRGIIFHELDSDAEVSDVLRQLAEGINFNLNSNHYLKPLCYRIEGHFQIGRSRWRGWLGSVTSSIPTWSSGSSSESDKFPEELPAE